MDLQRNKKELLELVTSYMKKMPLYEQFVLREVFWNEKCVKQIASEISMSEQKVIKLLENGKEQLKKDLETHLDFKFYRQDGFETDTFFQ